MAVINLKSQKGAALVTVIILGSVIGILALTTYRFVDVNMKQTGHLNLRHEAQYTAHAGIEAALYGLRNKTQDGLVGIVKPDGTSAGFDQAEEATLFFDVDKVTYGATRSSKLRRRTAEVKIIKDGLTRDGLRKRYKIISKTEYV